MDFSPDSIISYSILSLISLIFVAIWLGFFYFYSPKKTIPKKNLLFAFLLGILAAVFALVFERSFLSFLNIDLSFLRPEFNVQGFQDFIAPFLFAFFIAALVEETIKFFILEKYSKINAVNQAVDGMKIGIWLGLGFAFIENIVYFSQFYSQTPSLAELSKLILIRGFLPALAQALYGAVMGYYLSLAKFNRMFQVYFLKRAFLITVIVHGLFNFFLIVNLAYYSVSILIILLLSVIFWYHSRKNLEIYTKEKIFLMPSFLPDQREMETLFSKEQAPPSMFKQLLNLFPPKHEKTIKKKTS